MITTATADPIGRPLPALCVDLSPHANNTGVTSADNLSGGAFNIWANTYPREELPAPGRGIVLGSVPFRFPVPAADGSDNVRCTGQLVALPPGRYDWIYLLAAAERRTEDIVHLHFADGTSDPEWLRVSDFWPETPGRFGERESIRCAVLHYPRHVQPRMGPVIWRERVPVPREDTLVAMRLPDNPAVHLFAATLLAGSPLAGSPLAGAGEPSQATTGEQR